MAGATSLWARCWALAGWVAASLLLVGCSHRLASSPESSAWATASLLSQTPMWEHRTFKNRAPTDYRGTQHQGRPALHAHSRSGSSLMRHRLQWPGDRIGTLHFSWFIEALEPAFDLTDRDTEDAVARVILTFDGDRSRLSARDRALSELALLVTGEPLPYATLMYVWDHQHPEGTVLKHPASSRIRLLVVRSGADGLGRWQDIDRDVRADFEHMFGETPATLTGIGLMTDANNTGLTAQAWFGPVRLGTVVATEP